MALHEAGHALQHKEGVACFPARVAAIRSCRHIAGAVAILCGIAGVSRAIPVRIGGLIVAVTWPACFLANLLTMPAEFDASKRARNSVGLARAAGSRTEEVEAAMTGVAWRDLDALLGTFPALVYSLLPFSRKRPGRQKPPQRGRNPDTT